jgi:hypothetical protein
MITQINNSLKKINVQIIENNSTPEFSDYVFIFNNIKIIGYGWKRENEPELVGFWGWAMPALSGKLVTSFRLPDQLDFEEVINLFQFSLSDEYYWFSPPTNKCIAGFSCNALTDVDELFNALNLYIDANCDPEIFLRNNYSNNWRNREFE